MLRPLWRLPQGLAPGLRPCAQVPRACARPAAAWRAYSVLTYMPASAACEREVPTPLLFVSAPTWTGDKPAAELYAPWLAQLRDQGFSALCLDLDPDVSRAADAAEVLQVMERDMAATMRRPPAHVDGHGVAQPPAFPPALIARGAACAIAEMYASSFPLSALQLIDPPISMQRAMQRYPSVFGATSATDAAAAAAAPPLREFDFEAQFPVRVVWTRAELAWHAQHGVPWYEVHRIEHQREEAADESLDRYEWDTLESGVTDTVRWLEDEAGLYVCEADPR